MAQRGFVPVDRNRERIQHKVVRDLIDTKFETLHDGLSAAYYNFWRKELSSPWQGFDVQGTPAESKALFDKLHGLLFHLRDVLFHATNLRLPADKRIPEAEYDLILDDSGTVVGRRHLVAQAHIALRKLEGVEITVA